MNQNINQGSPSPPITPDHRHGAFFASFNPLTTTVASNNTDKFCNFATGGSTTFLSSTPSTSTSTFGVSGASSSWVTTTVMTSGILGGGGKRKVEETDLMEVTDLEDSEFRVAKISSIEEVAKDQFFIDSQGHLWNEEEFEDTGQYLSQESTTSTNSCSNSNSAFSDNSPVSVQAMGEIRGGRIKTAKRTLLKK